MSDGTNIVDESARIAALLKAVGHRDPQAAAPRLITYARALERWRGLGRETVGDHTWPAHVGDPATPSVSQ